MEKNDLPIGSSNTDQLKKYADDIAKVYQSEKQKRKELQTANEQLVKFADDLNKTVMDLRASNRELQAAYLDTIHRLVLAAEYKDEDTGDHIVRMSRFSGVIAEKLGLPAGEVEDILYAAPMHDIGKIGKLTDDEFEFMKTHAQIGAKILANAKAPILRLGQQIAISHHEKWNGRGYPQGHAGEKIPLVGRRSPLWAGSWVWPMYLTRSHPNVHIRSHILLKWLLI